MYVPGEERNIHVPLGLGVHSCLLKCPPLLVFAFVGDRSCSQPIAVPMPTLLSVNLVRVYREILIAQRTGEHMSFVFLL